jgi:hypothetical protein
LAVFYAVLLGFGYLVASVAARQELKLPCIRAPRKRCAVWLRKLTATDAWQTCFDVFTWLTGH